MSSKVEIPVNFSLLLEGYDQAFQRLKVAREASRTPQDAARIYIPLLETLGWADVIEEWLSKKHGEDWVQKLPSDVHKLDEVVVGFRYARNVVHHNWQTAIELDDLPELLRDWRWKETLFSERSQPTNKAAYKKRMSKRALRHTFKDLHKLYRHAEDTFV